MQNNVIWILKLPFINNLLYRCQTNVIEKTVVRVSALGIVPFGGVLTKCAENVRDKAITVCLRIVALG